MRQRDKVYWDSLRSPGISQEDAQAQLEAIFRAQPIAIKGHDGSSVNMRLKASVDADHILFKKEFGRKRAHRFTRQPTDFLSERASRINFILPTLTDPDEIWSENPHPQARFYVVRISRDELFLTVVERPSKSLTYFRTAFEVDLSNKHHLRSWAAKVKKSTMLYKRK